MENNIFFFLGLAFILTHEMDAIKNEEWTIFPLVSLLNYKTGYIVFTAIHILLYLLLFCGIYANGLNSYLITGLNIFFIVHVFLHVLYLKHPKNKFTSFFSWFVIIGAGVSGLLDILF